jgi:hypothetical protein
MRCSSFGHLWWLLCATFRNTYSQGRWFSWKIKQFSSYFTCVSALVDWISNFVWPHTSPLLIPYKHMFMRTNSHTHKHTHILTHIMGTIHPSQERGHVSHTNHKRVDILVNEKRIYNSQILLYKSPFQWTLPVVL